MATHHVETKEAHTLEPTRKEEQLENARAGELHGNGHIAGSARWGTIACGAGLFSDGYLNAVISPVGSILGEIYGKAYTDSPAQANVRALVFAGTVVGQLFFGWTSDHWSRKWSLMVSTVILIVFAILATGAYGGGSLDGMLKALTAYRFLLGIGIGGEYPAGSVGAAENTGGLKSGSRNRWFIMFTNVQIDLGFLVAPLVSMIVVIACGENHLRAAWRICLGIGVLPPLSLFFLRLKIGEPEPYKTEKMDVKHTPWLLVFKYYGFRLFLVSAIWFIYDLSAYSFGLGSTDIINNLLKNGGDESKLWVSIGWSTLINFFYLPGAIAGSFLSDTRVGARKTMFIALVLQAIVGFIMAGLYRKLASDTSKIAGFVIVYGIFLMLGEIGPGDQIGLFASKTSSTHIRGKYYGIAAAFGKLGAFVGAYIFAEITKTAPDKYASGSRQFYVGGGLAILAAFFTFFLPELHQDVIANEDIEFRAYLEKHGYDTSVLGVKHIDGHGHSNESVALDKLEHEEIRDTKTAHT